MLSKLFDSEKGELTYGKRTICEVHRGIYDLVVIHFQDKPEIMLQAIKLLEEAYMMGIKMNAKLVQNKCGNNGWSGDNLNKKEIMEMRKKRIKLIQLLEKNDKV